MKIIRDAIALEEIRRMAAGMFGDLVKAVIDVERELLAVNAELHSDLESILLNDGSKQQNLWGINLYPDIKGENFIEFDSIINIRPSQGNKSREVEDEELRRRITGIVKKRVNRES
jgi:hypothetical protein